MTPLRAILNERSMPEPNSGCQIWIAGLRARLYGSIRWRSRMYVAHRLSWEEAFGPIPVGMHVCHKCDVPSCINPAHLFLGSHAENMADMVRKGRQRNCGLLGERTRSAKLTAVLANAIYRDKRRQHVIARDYGITQGCVSDIKRGKSWSHAITFREAA